MYGAKDASLLGNEKLSGLLNFHSTGITTRGIANRRRNLEPHQSSRQHLAELSLRIYSEVLSIELS